MNIIIKDSEGSYQSMGKLETTIDLKGTVVEDYAPYGTGVENPHCKGWGNTPQGSLDNAYKRLGEHLSFILKPKSD